MSAKHLIEKQGAHLELAKQQRAQGSRTLEGRLEREALRDANWHPPCNSWGDDSSITQNAAHWWRPRNKLWLLSLNLIISTAARNPFNSEVFMSQLQWCVALHRWNQEKVGPCFFLGRKFSSKEGQAFTMVNPIRWELEKEVARTSNEIRCTCKMF